MFDSLFDAIRDQIDGASGGTGSGGGSGTTGAAVDSGLDEFQPDGSGTLPLAFGRHIVAGQLIQQSYTEGPPPVNKLAIALGEGEWEAAETVSWAGTDLSVSPDASTAGYRFYPGGITQAVDAFFSGGLTYSSTAYVAIRLTEAQSAENVTDKHRGIYQCLLVPDYNIAGVETDAGSYSVNPARVIAYGAKKAGLINRIHWPSWKRLKDYCDETISWNDGTSTRNIARFEAHPVWVNQVSFPAFMDAVCFLCGATWQDDGTLIRFLLPTDQTPVHHFELGSNSNTSSFKAKPLTLRERITKLTLKFRDLDDENLKPATMIIERPKLADLYGENAQEIAIANCNQSQARRIGEMWMRLTSDFVQRADLDGYGDSWHVLPGDYVTVTAPPVGWDRQLCKVTAATDLSNSTTADRRQYTVQKIDGPVYSDADQQPRQVQE